eukprot:Hpha_TRINITY_DN6187_c0_g1::TRINITY_DN6187_c0_g1_i1::g.165028::m.165028
MDPIDRYKEDQKLPSWVKPDGYGRPCAGVRSLRKHRIAIALEEKHMQPLDLDKTGASFVDLEELPPGFQESRAQRTPGFGVQTGATVRSNAWQPSDFLSQPGALVDRRESEAGRRRRVEALARLRKQRTVTLGYDFTPTKAPQRSLPPPREALVAARRDIDRRGRKEFWRRVLEEQGQTAFII